VLKPLSFQRSVLCIITLNTCKRVVLLHGGATLPPPGKLTAASQKLARYITQSFYMFLKSFGALQAEKDFQQQQFLCSDMCTMYSEIINDSRLDCVIYCGM